MRDSLINLKSLEKDIHGRIELEVFNKYKPGRIVFFKRGKMQDYQ